MINLNSEDLFENELEDTFSVLLLKHELTALLINWMSRIVLSEGEESATQIMIPCKNGDDLVIAIRHATPEELAEKLKRDPDYGKIKRCNSN